MGLLLPFYALARTITFNPTDDATVYSPVPTFNYGAVCSILASKAFSRTTLTGERQAYLKFDLSGLAGVNPADVTSVVLHLHNELLHFPGFLHGQLGLGEEIISPLIMRISQFLISSSELKYSKKVCLCGARKD